MDSVPDPPLTNSPINSVLKPPKQRVPLKDLMAAGPEEDNTASRKRRVSFANVNKIKEFSAGAESMVVCQTPAYEEPFSVSSDSSYPSGIDGWTPAKGQPSLPAKPLVCPEKENVSIQSLRMSTGMDLTSGIGNLYQNTRYSVNGMDLTELASLHATNDQQTRYSGGMDLTNAVGQQYKNTRYSVSGLDLTCMGPTTQGFVDQRTRFSMGVDMTNHSTYGTRYSVNGMDLTEVVNLVGHSTQNTRYSMNGMDFTEAINPQQTFLDQKSVRFSLGMDTNRHSFNQMDFIETSNPFNYREQSEGGVPANASLDDSDVLELTEAVGGVEVTAPSPKYKTSNVGLAENVLYSVNNTRYSANSMDLTKVIGSRMSSGRRKSSRFSLVGMDLGEMESCDDLEFTQAVGDPRITDGLARVSVCYMDKADSLIGDGVSELPQGNMDCTSVGEELEYSADTESIIGTFYSSKNPVNGKENILPNQTHCNTDVPIVLPIEDPVCDDSKPNDRRSSSDVHKALLEVTTHHHIDNENEHVKHIQNTVSSNNSISINHKTCGNLLNENSQKIEKANDLIKDNLLISDISGFRSLEKYSEDTTEMNIKESDSLPLMHEELKILNETVEKTAAKDRQLNNEMATSEKPSSLNTSNCTIKDQKKERDVTNLSLNLDESNFENDRVNSTNTDNLEQGPNRNESTAMQLKADTTCSEDSALKNLCINEEQDISEQKIFNNEAMDISIILNTDVNNTDFEVIKNSSISGIEIPEIKITHTENKETTVSAPEEVRSLNDSVMNMSIDDCSLTKEVEDLEKNELRENNDGSEKYISVADGEIGHQINNALHFNLEKSHQPSFESTTKDQCIEFNVSTNISLNLSSRSVLCNNVTMTRGKSKSLNITPDLSLEISQQDNITVKESKETAESKETPILLSMSVTLTSPVKDCEINHSGNTTKIETSSLESESNIEKRGKRSFEVALEPENDTEESPVKLLRLSREEPSTEYVLNNVTAPSFLMETVATSHDTLPCLDHHESLKDVNHHEQTLKSADEQNPRLTTASESVGRAYDSLSLRMDEYLIPNMSEKSLCNEVIDLCESSFEATSTEVRDLINSSRYKTRNFCDEMTIKEQNKSLDSLQDKIASENVLIDHNKSNQALQSYLAKEQCNNARPNLGVITSVKAMETEARGLCFAPTKHLKSGSRRKKEKVTCLGNNSYAACFIPNFVDIHFSIDTLDLVKSVSYHSICSGRDAEIGEYLLKQAQDYILPEKGADLISQLQSKIKSPLACLAKSLNLICKYYNGSIKGDVLTFEIASCYRRFWTLIDINIRHPHYLNQTDITISKQKIGELKLSDIRKMFNSTEKNENQLLNFAKALNELQYNN